MKKNTGKIPRPLNSFMIYRLEKQKEILDQCPGANHRDISKIVSKWWNELSDKEKQPYILKADKLKIEHREKYPQYKFTPIKRKGSTRRYNRKAIHELSALDVKKKERLISRYSKELTYDDVFCTQKSTKASPSLSEAYYYTIPSHQNTTTVTDSFYSIVPSFIPPVQSDYYYAYYYYGFYNPLI